MRKYLVLGCNVGVLQFSMSDTVLRCESPAYPPWGELRVFSFPARESRILCLSSVVFGVVARRCLVSKLIILATVYFTRGEA